MSDWNIENQPLDYQVQYWKTAAQHNADKAAQKAPERLHELQATIATQANTIAMLRVDAQNWQDVARTFADRTVALESDGAAALLRKERDFWRDRWRHATRAMARMLEHRGNVELLESELAMVRQPERVLTTMDGE